MHYFASNAATSQSFETLPVSLKDDNETNNLHIDFSNFRTTLFRTREKFLCADIRKWRHYSLIQMATRKI